MALIDSQGRIYIGEEAGKRLGYEPGVRIAFVMVDQMLYRLSDPGDRLLGENVVVCENTMVDEKYRFVVPKPIRKMYTKEANILEKEGSLYIQFFRLQSDEEWLRAKLLGAMTDDRK